MFNNRNKSPNETVNLLDLTPVRAKEFDVSPEGIVTLKIPRFTNKILVALLMRRLKKPLIRVTLDEIGSTVWLGINGETSTSGLVDIIIKKYGADFTQAPERVAVYLKQMYQNGFIKFKEFPTKKG